MKTEDVFKKFTLMRPEFRKGVYPRKEKKNTVILNVLNLTHFH